MSGERVSASELWADDSNRTGLAALTDAAAPRQLVLDAGQRNGQASPFRAASSRPEARKAA